MGSSTILTLTPENFSAEVLESPTPVLVDFWADWCAPCKMMAAILDELATEYDGRVKIGKVDVEAHESLGSQYGVKALPTVMVFRNGQVVDQVVGLKSKRDFKNKLDSFLA